MPRKSNFQRESEALSISRRECYNLDGLKLESQSRATMPVQHDSCRAAVAESCVHVSKDHVEQRTERGCVTDREAVVNIGM